MHKLIGLKLTWMSFLKKKKKIKKIIIIKNPTKIPFDYSSTKELSEKLSGSTSLFTYQRNIVESVQHTDSSS